MITVLLADPHALHRLGLRTLLTSRPGLTIAGEATTAAETARLDERLRPDVVLLGSGLPATDVTTTVRRLRQTRPPGSAAPRVLVLSSAHRDEHAYDVLRAGADGFLPATTTPDDLVTALSTVAAGNAVVSPRLAGALIHPSATASAPQYRSPRAGWRTSPNANAMSWQPWPPAAPTPRSPHSSPSPRPPSSPTSAES
ncbi:response regulator transcription factor [Streptomyces sp. NPDC020951]|uniref:response regulator transcription factor n=1 Tax=Streptomyces sp. NPDC020951 TaxID=3365104 RepID=UPI003792F9A2